MNAQKNQKNKKKSVYHIDTTQPMLVRAYPGLDSSRALQKIIQKSQNRENRKKKNDNKDQHTYSHEPSAQKSFV